MAADNVKLSDLEFEILQSVHYEGDYALHEVKVMAAQYCQNCTQDELRKQATSALVRLLSAGLIKLFKRINANNEFVEVEPGKTQQALAEEEQWNGNNKTGPIDIVVLATTVGDGVYGAIEQERVAAGHMPGRPKNWTR